jgi:hypothetical protein
MNPRQQIHLVEESVWSQLQAFLGDESAIKRAVQRAQGEQDSLARELEHHREALRLTEKTAAGLVGSLAGLEDDVVLKPLRVRLLALSDQAAAHRRAIIDLETRLLAGEAVAMSLHEIRALGGLDYLSDADLAELLEQSGPTPQQRREVLMNLGCQVILLNKEVKVELDLRLVTTASAPTGRGSSTATSSPPTSWSACMTACLCPR